MAMAQDINTLNEALKSFEATEANLAKLEALWKEISALIPEGIAFGGDADGIYDDRCRAFSDVAAGLPKIDGNELQVGIFAYDEIGQMRLDAKEAGMIECELSVETAIFEQDRHLKEYRYRLNKKRRQLIRNKLLEVIDNIDRALRELSEFYPDDYEKTNDAVAGQRWEVLTESVATIDALLGSSVKRPRRWNDLSRHIHFGLVQDFHDIKTLDWPEVKQGIEATIYGDTDPIPVGVADLGELVDSGPRGEIITKLKWDSLDESEFERLLYVLFSTSSGYENSAWLTKTNAPDRGRDISVDRIHTDSLGGTLRQRVIVQCKHWRTKSINQNEVVTMKEQMKLWEPPRVDVFVIATSGTFTTDAVDYVEKTNQGDTGMRIEMWPESHLESLLARRPALIAEFKLR
jgi:hypothetical protein